MNGFEVKPGSLPKPAEDMTAYLGRLFTVDSQPYRQLAYEVQREFKHGGSPDVRRMSIDRVHFDLQMGKGSFRVVLDIDFTFGCEDVRTQKQDQTSEWGFSVDAEKEIIRFEDSPYAESRSTADEF